MNNDLITKTGNKFPVFNFGSDLMNLKFLIVLTMVLSSLFILPVNAAINIDIIADSTPLTYNLGIISDKTVLLTFYKPNNQGVISLPNNPEGIVIFISNAQNCQIDDRDPTNLVLNENANTAIFTYTARHAAFGILGSATVTINYDYNPSAFPDNEYDIDIDLQEQTIELGHINNLEQTFDIGSVSERVVNRYTSYASMSCTIDDLERNFVKIKFDKDYDYAEIFLSGKALKDTTESDFTTQVKFNYTYTQGLQAFIQTYDYQNGNMLSGVNISVYEVIENGNSLEIGNLIYTSSNSESQTILNLKQDTEYFVKNEKTGYFSVKNTEYDYLNGETGYLWNPSIDNPLRLYYSRLDENAQYNANFIVQDVNNNGISGVSVTMDNAVTKISNSIGGLTFNNISAGTHTFVFVKNGYQTAQQTIDIQLQYAAFYQTMYKDNQIIQPTVSPTAYPTVQPTVSPTLQPTFSPIDQPTNLGESIKYGLAKMFGVNSLNTINLIFALLIILFPAVVGAVVTNQALGFISGGLIGFVFALGIGLIPIWVFFSMIMLSVIYLVMTHTEAGF